MRTVTVSGTGAGTLLVAAGSGNSLIMNQDPNNNSIVMGDTTAVDPADTSNVVPLNAPGFVVVDGQSDVYGKATTNTPVTINIVPGGLSFFQPVSQFVVQGNKAGLFVYNGTPALGTLAIAISATGGTDKYGNTYQGGMSFFDQGGLAPVIDEIFFTPAPDPTTGAYVAGDISVSALGVGVGAIPELSIFSPMSPVSPGGGLQARIDMKGSPSNSRVTGIDLTTGLVSILQDLTGVGSGGLHVQGQTQLDRLTTVGGSPVAVVVGSVQLTSASVAVGATETVIMSMTFTAINGVKYDVEFRPAVAQTVGSDIFVYTIRLDSVSGTSIFASGFGTGTATFGEQDTLGVQWTSNVSGSKTIVLTAFRGSGTGTTTAQATSNGKILRMS